jgi:DHA2 family multidrug resistance protein
MPGPIPTGPFSMPMYRDFVPKAIRPWIYVLFLMFFQLAGCLYLGAASQIADGLSLMRDDVMFIGLCNVIGVNMPFPLLFRFKFRFTNRQLLLNAAIIIAVCNLLALYVRSVPLLCILSFLAGFFKLCGTFECASNIQLWFAPNRDFRIFFPVLYIIVVGDIFLQGWLAGIITYYYAWQMMNWLIIGLMLFIIITVYVLTKNFRFMKPLPLISVDWLGCVLWSLLMIEVVWIFNYGEFYNWWDGRMFRLVVVALCLTLVVTLQRERHIRHPYISLDAFKYKTLVPILALYFVAEWLNTTPKVLQTSFTAGVMHWGTMTTTVFDLVGWIGNLAGCLFTLWWMKGLKMKYTQLLSIGGAALVAYQIMMYFYIAPDLPIGRLYLPLFMRAFGYAIYFTALTIYLEELMPFQHFFMGLTISGFMRNGPVEAILSGWYSFGLRYKMADNIVRTLPYEPMQTLMVSLKQLFGLTSIIGCLFLLCLLLYDVQPVRSTLRKMPYWNVLGRGMRKQIGRVRHKVRLFG